MAQVRDFTAFLHCCCTFSCAGYGSGSRFHRISTLLLNLLLCWLWLRFAISPHFYTVAEPSSLLFFRIFTLFINLLLCCLWFRFAISPHFYTVASPSLW